MKRSEERPAGEDESVRGRGQGPREHPTSKEGSQKDIWKRNAVAFLLHPLLQGIQGILVQGRQVLSKLTLSEEEERKEKGTLKLRKDHFQNYNDQYLMFIFNI